MSKVFTPLNGGAGITIACNTSTSTRAALPALDPPAVATAVAVSNTGVNYAYLALGEDDVTATTACQVVVPGAPPLILGIAYAGGTRAPNYVAGISSGGATTLQITLGSIAGIGDP